MQTTLSGNTERMISMKKLMELLKNELNVNWSNELDAVTGVIGLMDVDAGKASYYAMRNNTFELYVTKGKVLGEKRVLVKYTVYDEFEERNIKVSPELFHRFVKALEEYTRETEKDRMMKRYHWEIEKLVNQKVEKRLKKMKRNDNYTMDELEKKPPVGSMIKH